ncbi:MAG: phosphate/phosphite/phosphonate ABC transporter substrate-binding protein [Chloroflexi bacterium]|nr:phosphate/phosphite/phosphonate ABC transporter substrate-binding protein [Chloroflexota bacterium]
MARQLFLGAVAYDPKTVTLWEGFRAWLAEAGLDFDYALFSNYERQAEALLSGEVNVAWNSPLAWVRCRRLAAARGRQAHALVMRDTDQDLASIVIVRSDSDVRSIDALRGRTIATGAVDSPQATLLPLYHLHKAGLTASQDFQVRRFDLGVGKHGDHIGGEGEAAKALMKGEVDAACIMDGTRLMLAREGVLREGDIRVIAQTDLYDHCNMTALELSPELEKFRDQLFQMSYEDPRVRPLLDLEGLKVWKEGRTQGYAALEAAVDLARFYDAHGAVTASEYRP